MACPSERALWPARPAGLPAASPIWSRAAGQAEGLLEAGGPAGGQPDQAAAGWLLDPAAADKFGGEGGADGAGQVGRPLGGVQALEGQPPTPRCQAGEVDAEAGQGRRCRSAEAYCPVGPLLVRTAVQKRPVDGQPPRARPGGRSKCARCRDGDGRNRPGARCLLQAVSLAGRRAHGHRSHPDVDSELAIRPGRRSLLTN